MTPSPYVIECLIRGRWTRSGFIFDSMVEAELFALGNFKAVKTRVAPYAPEARS